MPTFEDVYRPDNAPVAGDDAPLRRWDSVAAGFTGFMKRFSGCSFDGGTYRVHAVSHVLKWTSLCSEGFPDYSERILCFASDWLGGQFALDRGRMNGSKCLLLLFEPGVGEAMEVPVDLHSFHNEELFAHRRDALSIDLLTTWSAGGGTMPRREQCVGYRQPLFLGGTDSVENLKLIDMEVYWSICAELLTQTRGLAAGTRLGSVKIE